MRERAERMLISQYMAQGELEQAEEQLARLPQEDRERPMLEAMLRRKQKRSEEAWPILERELFRQASDLQSTLMALMDLALEAGDKACARQYSETAEQAGRVFQLTAYAVASAPPSWRWRSRTAPRRWRCWNGSCAAWRSPGT